MILDRSSLALFSCVLSTALVLWGIKKRSGKFKTFPLLVLEIQSQVKNKATTSSPLWIGISGIPGAGKSTLAEKLSQKLHPLRTAVVGMDGYHFSRQELDTFENAAEAHAKRGAPFTFDSSRFATELARNRTLLAQKQTVYFPTFDHALKDPVEKGCQIEPSVQVVIVEGNYLLLWKHLLQLDVNCYLDVDIPVAKHRLAHRHVIAWGWTLEQAMQRVEESDYANMLLVQSTASQADVVILEG